MTEKTSTPTNRDYLGKRGFTEYEGKSTTVTVINVNFDEGDKDAAILLTEDGRQLNGTLSEVTFDEPTDEPEVVAEAPATPAPQPGLTIRDTQSSAILDPNMYIQMKALSSDFFNSKAVPSAYVNALQVLMALQAGKEMGLQPIESIQSLTIINGNISLWGKAVPNRLRQHGWKLSFNEGMGDEKDERSQFCEATITHSTTGETFTDRITYGEAIDSGYTRDRSNNLKPGWLKGMNRRLKLRYDVLDVLCKTYVPEVFGPTAGTAEVLQDVDFTEAKPESMKDKIKAATAGPKLDTKAKAKDYSNAQDGEVVEE